MSTRVATRETSNGPSAVGRSALWGAAAFAAAAFVIIYGTYGDPSPKSSQKDAVPLLIGVGLIFGAVLFAAAVPLILRKADHPERWALGMSALGIVSLAAFWSGAPILLGAAGLFLAGEARPRSRATTVAFALGSLAALAPVVVTVLVNAILPS